MKTNLKEYEDYVAFRWKPPALNADAAMLCYITTCMTGEAGETADAVKKYVKGKGSLENIILEMGDTFYYLTALANHLNIPIHEVLKQNKTKLDERNAIYKS